VADSPGATVVAWPTLRMAKRLPSSGASENCCGTPAGGSQTVAKWWRSIAIQPSVTPLLSGPSLAKSSKARVSKWSCGLYQAAPTKLNTSGLVNIAMRGGGGGGTRISCWNKCPLNGASPSLRNSWRRPMA